MPGSIICSSHHPTASDAGWCSHTPTAASCRCRTMKHTVAISCTNAAAHQTHGCYQLSASCEIQHNSYLPHLMNQRTLCLRYAKSWEACSCPPTRPCTGAPQTHSNCHHLLAAPLKQLCCSNPGYDFSFPSATPSDSSSAPSLSSCRDGGRGTGLDGEATSLENLPALLQSLGKEC